MFAATGRCVVETLFGFIRNADDLRFNTSMSFVFTTTDNDTMAIGGSNVTLECRNNYMNIGGSLTIVCTKDNVWTSFPRCVSTSNETTTTIATTDAAAALRCALTNETWLFPNGYILNTANITAYVDNTVEGHCE
jgi:hypothetical protein